MEMELTEGLKTLFVNGKFCGEDKEKEKILIEKISRCLEEYTKEKGAWVLLEIQERETPLIEIRLR